VCVTKGKKIQWQWKALEKKKLRKHAEKENWWKKTTMASDLYWTEKQSKKCGEKNEFLEQSHRKWGQAEHKSRPLECIPPPVRGIEFSSRRNGVVLDGGGWF
jgi:hypothetical protein